MQFHCRALIVTHKLSSLVHNLFLLLRQSHYDYATELSLDLLVGGPLLTACRRGLRRGSECRDRIPPAITPETAKTILALGRRKCFGKCPLRGGHLKLIAFSSYLPGQFEGARQGLQMLRQLKSTLPVTSIWPALRDAGCSVTWQSRKRNKSIPRTGRPRH